MQCPRCHSQNREDVRFCEDCGSRLTASCPSCGSELTVGRRFCGNCGAALTTYAAPARFASPQAYTPEYLARKIRTSRNLLEGERKQITVLFADTRGSMELIADRDPEEARVLLDTILEHMMEAVHRYEGTVNQVAGDGVMALFGAPLAHEDHAARGCYAALTMLESVERYAADLPSCLGADIGIRVGLNSDEVMIRSIKSDLRMDYAATGRAVHLAARMEQMAQPGTSLITGTTFALTEGLFDVKPLGPVVVKGLADPVPTYRLLAVRQSHTRFQATSVARGLSRLTGRTLELDRLEEIYDQVGRNGQLVALVGEPGVGKSRLLYEFIRSRSSLECTVLVGQGASYAGQTAYYPIVGLIKSYLGIELSDGGAEILAKTVAKVAALGRDLENTVSALLWLLDEPVDEPGWRALDAAGRREQAATALKRLFLALSGAQPLLLVFEDLHWIDTETQAFLDDLVGILSAAPIMLAVTYRPEYLHQWAGRETYTQLRINPLPPPGAEELLAHLLGTDASLGPLKGTLIARTEGNPLFLEETVRALVESRILVGQPRAYKTSAQMEKIDIPASVQAVLAARIDRLTPAEKHVLQSASVIGTDAPLALLREIVNLSNDELLSILPGLQAAELLYQTALYPEMQYSFKHSLTQEVAYSGLLREHRRMLHAAVLDAVERLYAGRIAERIEDLARHAVRGEKWEKAVHYLRQAGVQAAQRSAHQVALGFFNEALAAVAQLPAQEAHMEQAIELHFAARNSLWPLWDHEAMLRHLIDAEKLASLLGDKRHLGLLASFMIQHYRVIGQPDRAIEAADRAFAIARELNDFDLEVDTNFRLGLSYLNLGDYRSAADFLSRNVTALDGGRSYRRADQPGLPAVLSRAWLAIALAEQGRFDEALARSGEAVAIATLVNHIYSLVSALFGLGGVQLYQGDIAAAQETLETASALCRQHDIPVLLRLLASELGYARLLAGRSVDAIPLLEHAAEIDTATPTMARHALYLVWLGEAYLHDGQTDEADRLCRRAIDIARQRKEPGHEAWALRLAGEILARQPSPDLSAAAVRLDAAITLANRLDMRTLVAWSQLGRGHVLVGMGRLQEAQQAFGAAQVLLGRAHIPAWLAGGAGMFASSAPN
jgi:class 3 adenylate cyclase/tetratricopeptide (TPR) repeat protein